MTSTLRKRDLKRCCAEGSSCAVRARPPAQKRRPRHPAFKRNDGAVADVGGVTVKGEESESRLSPGIHHAWSLTPSEAVIQTSSTFKPRGCHSPSRRPG